MEIDITGQCGQSGKTLPVGTDPVEVIDIRQAAVGINIVAELRSGLRAPIGAEKRLPTLLLYDEAGLRLFEQITYLDEYYLTGQEIAILEKYADEIADRIVPHSIVVELGSGALRKVNILLQALERAKKKVDYYALDLDRAELERTLRDITCNYQYVTARGLHGTYDDGASWLANPLRVNVPKCILSLGSSIGNLTQDSGANFVKQFADTLSPGHVVLIGIDSCKDLVAVSHAYADRGGVTHRFILNGLKHANRLLKTRAFDLRKWRVIDEVDEWGHYAFVSPTEDVLIEGVLIKRDERVRIEESFKFSGQQVLDILQHARLAVGARWANASGTYKLHMASKPTVCLPTKVREYAAQPAPSLQEFEHLWGVWDMVTQHMLPMTELLSKPIKLRNACIFYLGHIPTFLDMQIAKGTDGILTEPKHYSTIFERGVDPDVDNPEHVHAHSEIPDSWPPVEEILAFQDRVRARVRSLYKSGVAMDDRKVARILWLGLEHDIMHLETLLYMLLQSEKTRPPKGIIIPDFAAMAEEAAIHEVPNEWIDIPARAITMGLDDPENDDGPDRYFGWDNEKPQRTAPVHSFQAKARPITNGEFAEYLENEHLTDMPASWKVAETAMNGAVNGTNGVKANGQVSGKPSKAFLQGKSLKTVFGSVPLEQALSWPVFASYDQLAGCAAWMGGRIPTNEEVQSIYTYADELKSKIQEKTSANIPAVNGHLGNDGVEETPPCNGTLNLSPSARPSPESLFVDLDEANVGFKHWHPIPVTQNGAKLSGRGEMGGVWEWTSSVLEKHDGFEPMRLYPVYTADFFDTKHNIVLGGSWATQPRIAGRKTFINWYQRNYPYVWAGARLVRDY